MNERNLPTWPGWETVRLIGRGSFGAVYEIERSVYGHKEQAAMKVITIPQSESDIEELYDSGYDEASVTATFQSHLEKIVNEYSLMREMNGAANVVNCDDIRVVEHDDSVGWDIYIRMELLTPLAKAVDKQPSDETVIQIASDICKALILCRKHDIIHRDIKPQNIFVSKNGDYKLGDFGIAKTMEKTSGGTKIGTYKYMAPEVYNNQGYNLTADIYSLGLVLYWLLNERRTPFLPLPPVTPTSTEEDSARTRRFKGEAIPAPAHGSKELQRIIRKTCAYDPKDRYQSAEEMLHALERLRDPTASATPETEEDEEDLTVGGFHDTSANSGTSEKDKQAADKDDSATVSAFGDKTSHHGDEKDGTSTPQKPLAPASWLVVCLIVLAGLMSVLAFKYRVTMVQLLRFRHPHLQSDPRLQLLRPPYPRRNRPRCQQQNRLQRLHQLLSQQARRRQAKMTLSLLVKTWSIRRIALIFPSMRPCMLNRRRDIQSMYISPPKSAKIIGEAILRMKETK